MSTTLRILGWKAEGLRCPDHEVSFANGNNLYQVSLLQMPNGTGKTTTLELLRAALSGAAASPLWDRKKVISLAKKGSTTPKGRFQLNLLHDAKRLTITMHFDFEAGTVRYQTTAGAGAKDGFQPPRDLARFLRPEFVRFFVFDGELAEQLLSHDHTDAQTVIEELFQLSLFPQVSARVKQYWDAQTANRSAKDDRGFSRRRNRVQELAKRLAEVTRIRDGLTSTRSDRDHELLKQRNKYNTDLSKDQERAARQQAAQDALTVARAELKRLSEQTLARMRDPHALAAVFGQEMAGLKASLDRVKLPESTAREFFEELAQESHCVCGRELDDDSRRGIRERAKRYLGSDEMTLLNAIKHDIQQSVGPDPVLHETQLTGATTTLIEAAQKEGELRTVLERIEVEARQLNPELEEAKKRIDALQAEIRTLDAEIAKYEAPDAPETTPDDELCSIAVLKERLEDAEVQLAEITETLELKRKRDLLEQIINLAQAKARTSLSRRICSESNARIQALMPQNAITIQQVERCLVLHGQEGGSVGETLSVAYAFLASLFDHSAHQLPFVVDSPANPIDLRVRAKVAELIPRLSKQFIAFTISSERQGFIGPLENACSDIQYTTMFRKGPADLERAAKGVAGTVESTDGFCVVDKAFFKQFHLDEEGPNGAV